MAEKETKKCPFCWEEILATAIKCKHCWEFLDKEQKVENKEEVKVEEKKGSIWKWILQLFVFLVVRILSTVRWENSLLLWVVLFEVVLFRYCFVSYTDKNPFFDKEIITRIKTDKSRWIWFIIIWFCFGRMMLGWYTWKYSEKIHDIQHL